MLHCIIKWYLDENSDGQSHGWCLNNNGSDQEQGYSMFPEPLEKNACLAACHTMQKYVAITGCEHNLYGACTYHTMPISGGSGDHGYTCWVLEKDKFITRN